MGAAGAPRHVVEGHLDDAPALGVDADQDLLEHVEVPGLQGEPRDHVSTVHPKSAREIAKREGERPPVRAVEDLAQEAPEPAHVGAPAGDVAGGDEDLPFVPSLPEALQEERPVR